MLNDAQYTTQKARYERFQAWVDTRRGKNGWASYKDEDIPDALVHDKLTNEEIAQLEAYEFMRDKPTKYFAYVNLERNQVGTFTGLPLGTILSLGRPFKVGFWPGAERRSIRFKGINGLTYAGFYYCGSGDYCRVKAVKN